VTRSEKNRRSMDKHPRICHPSDFSAAARPAFRQAVSLAKTLHGELVLVHVLSPIVTPALGAEVYIGAAFYDDLLRAARAAARRHLDQLVVQAKRAGVRVSARLVEGLPVHELIGRTAKMLRARLLVMGTHGRTGVSQFVLSSVAARVIATAPCPVLTVRGRSRREQRNRR